MTTEQYDTSSKRGKYGTLVADRVMVSADGRAPSTDALKGVVASVDLGQIERLAPRASLTLQRQAPSPYYGG